jgi:DNA-binding IclR family transcriptional regulator
MEILAGIKQIATDSSLNPNAFKVLVYLVTCINPPESDLCITETVRTISRAMNLSQSTVRRCLKELEQRQLLAQGEHKFGYSFPWRKSGNSLT